MMTSRRSWTITVVLLMAATAALAMEPADKDLIPEGRAVLSYLESVCGRKTLARGNGTKGIESIRSVCGKEPAIATFDLSGWNSPPWGKSYNGVVQNSVDAARAWWQQGGIVTMQLLVKERGLHNLIWVYSAALRCGKGGEGLENVAGHQRFYPGDAYVDIAGINRRACSRRTISRAATTSSQGTSTTVKSSGDTRSAMNGTRNVRR